MIQGKVKSLVPAKGFGFLIGDDGNEHFFHVSNTPDFDHLVIGDRVTFDIGKSRDGRPRATRVAVVRRAAP